jgi:hypothetical protein
LLKEVQKLCRNLPTKLTQSVSETSAVS